MHEESFPYLFKPHIKKRYIESLLLDKSISCLIFTNFSQKVFFKEEFGVLPIKSKVLPNGVEIEKFCNISMRKNFVLTYLGQFNHWKNIELIFKTLSLLDEKYTLKIAGGKGDRESDIFITNLIKKYHINPSRVNYLGFIDNDNVADKVLNDSNVLLVPLGDNIQSIFLTSPMKLFEYMATKVPILAVDYPSIRLITADKVFLSQNNAKNFAEQINVICNMRQKDFNFNLVNNVAQKYSYENRSKKFLNEVINEL